MTEDKVMVWVTTPHCSECIPKPEYISRRSCMGCDRLRPKRAIAVPDKKIKPQQILPRLVRNSEINKLREQGLSYGAIAKGLKIPRSTVQNILSRNK